MNYSDILEQWSIADSSSQSIVTIFENVRDIPYGDIGSRDPLEVFEQNQGTCSGKHFLLKGLYQELGIKTKDIIRIHAFNDLHVQWSPSVQKILDQAEILDPHNYIKILVNGEWISVDCTWDSGLKPYGFIVNEHGNGKTSMDVAFSNKKEFETTDPEKQKKEIIAEFPEHIQRLRKKFLTELTTWLKTLR